MGYMFYGCIKIEVQIKNSPNWFGDGLNKDQYTIIK